MEGPSLVIASEEFKPFLKKPIQVAKGTAKLPFKEIRGSQLTKVRSWGKNFLLTFDTGMTLRIHFLMFGSYRIDNPRENRIPKMVLKIAGSQIYFYSCAIKVLEEKPETIYDWSVDTMSKEWSQPKALKKVRALPDSMICDLLMDQEIFSGIGNIIKNEIQFRQRLHPETKIGDMTAPQQRALVKDARDYCHQFYVWKKANVLKRNWQIMRKKKCPICGGKVTKAPTGKLKRLSHWCKRDQKLEV